LANTILWAESKAFVDIFLKMESKLIFDGPMFFCTLSCFEHKGSASFPHSQTPCQFNKARATCRLSTLPLRAHFGAAYVAARSQPALLQPFHRLHT
jgi:hypothetical protein